jgi:hypothetical protein
MSDSFSQAGQDIFVSYLVNTKDKKYFVDIGCWVPDTINNTLKLENEGWDGVSLDITDLTKEWEKRNTKFVCSDALSIDYKKIFDDSMFPDIIDYLTIDLEGNDTRIQALKRVFSSGREFKVITIEHDSYRGYELSEKTPQREFLNNLGYVLVGDNVHLSGNPFEDWWVNPKYILKEKYESLISRNVEYTEIIKKCIS